MTSTVELMREFKALSDQRRQGTLAPAQEQRLMQIKVLLDGQMPARPPQAPPAPAKAPSAIPEPMMLGLEARATPQSLMVEMPSELRGEVDKSAQAAQSAAAARAAQAADEAIKATKTRPRASTQDEAVKQMAEVQQQSQYTPPDLALQGDGYFGYDAEGYEALPDAAVELPLYDPREAELLKLKQALEGGAAESGGPQYPSITPGGVFLDDFLELYTTGILLVDDPALDEDEGDTSDPSYVIPGKRKVTVHMANGEVKRGVILRMKRGEPGFNLLPQGAGKAESISMTQVKAIFITLNPGVAPPTPSGRNVNVVFKDRRSIQGATADYGKAELFTLIPPPGRGGFEKILVNGAHVQEVQ